jgi:DNA-binding NarL/FixJ family response regulator
MATPTRIFLIDDHAIMRDGLRMVFHLMLPGTEVLEASSLDEALRADAQAPDIIVLDVKLPGLNGVNGIALLKRKWPSVPVLILSSMDDIETERRAYAHGAAGFLSKAEKAEKIVETINLALQGRLSTPQSSAHADPVEQQRQLTPRQYEVLALLCQGLSNKLIAQQLSLSHNTVRRHVQDILALFQVTSRAEAMYVARNQGLVN